MTRPFPLALAVLCALAGLAPLLVAAPAPLMDWPSHLARVWITARVLDGDAFWLERYRFQGFLIPNAVLDAAVLGMMRAGLSVRQAGVAFLVLLYLAFVGGALRWALRIGAASALTVPLAVTCFYGTLLFYGLVNFVAGLAVMAWVMAAWVGLPDRPVRRALLAVAATAAIALCHVVAAVVFVGLAACVDLWALLRRRAALPNAVAPAAAAAIVLAAILAGSPVEAGGSAGISYAGDGSASAFLWRKGVILVRAMSSGQPGPDIVMAVIGVAVTLAAVRVRAGAGGAWVLAMAGLLGLAIVAPDQIGEGAFLDARLVPVVLLIAAVSVRLDRVGRPAAAAVAALVVLRLGLLAIDWHRAGQQHLALEAELARLPPGSTLLAGVATPSGRMSWWQEWSPPAGNIASLAAAHGVFVPSVFASPSQHPLVLRDAWRRWRFYQDVATPAERRAAFSDTPDCTRYGPISMLILHAGGAAAETGPPVIAAGPPAFPYVLLRLC